MLRRLYIIRRFTLRSARKRICVKSGICVSFSFNNIIIIICLILWVTTYFIYITSKICTYYFSQKNKISIFDLFWDKHIKVEYIIMIIFYFEYICILYMLSLNQQHVKFMPIIILFLGSFCKKYNISFRIWKSHNLN